MEGELGELSRDNKALQLAMTQKDLRLDATAKDMLHEKQSVQYLKVELKNIKTGLHNTSRFIQEPKELKEKIKELYRKHLHDFDQVRYVLAIIMPPQLLQFQSKLCLLHVLCFTIIIIIMFEYVHLYNNVSGLASSTCSVRSARFDHNQQLSKLDHWLCEAADT